MIDGTALLGGSLIGAAALFLYLLQGRVFGVSGILGGILDPRAPTSSRSWQIAIALGLILTGAIAARLLPESFGLDLERSPARVIAAGLLVGFGTGLGSGCTSGHGVCGVSRLSRRSLAATATFIFFGALTVFALRRGGVSLP